MNSLQHLTLATVISILGLNATKVARVDAEVIADKSAFSTQNNASFTVAKGDRFFLAQKSSDKKSPETEDEMIKELQKRDKLPTTHYPLPTTHYLPIAD